jgi:hypothetical protein
LRFGFSCPSLAPFATKPNFGAALRMH